MTEKQRVHLRVNDVAYDLELEPRRLLVDVLRHDLGLTGTHVGCEHGVCGACTVIIDGSLVRACLAFAVQFDGASIETVEGLAKGSELSELQRVFADKAALQCGFCTPGFLMLSACYLRREPCPTDEGIREAMSSNLCRCTGYQQINAAVREVAHRLVDEDVVVPAADRAGA